MKKVESFYWVFMAPVSLGFHHPISSVVIFRSHHTGLTLTATWVVLHLKCSRPLHHVSSIEMFQFPNPHVSVSFYSAVLPLSFPPSTSPTSALPKLKPLLSPKWQWSERQAGFCCLHKLSVLRSLCIPRSKWGPVWAAEVPLICSSQQENP